MVAGRIAGGVLAGLALTAGVSAEAQEPIQLDDVIVSANRTPTAAARTGAAVSVITQEDLEDQGQTRLVDYLARVPGLALAQTGGPGNPGTVSIRGAFQQYIQVRIDGIEVSDPSSPQVSPELEQLLVGDIARVEILKGSQSTLYGGEAVGGLIDITTKRAMRDGLSTSVAAEGGSFGTLRGAATVSGGFERADFSVTAQRYQTNGFSAADENNGNTEDDGYENTTVSGSGAVSLTETLTLRASARYTSYETEFDGFDFVTFLPTDDGIGTNTVGEQWGGRLAASLRLFDGRWENEISGQYYSTERDTESSFPNSFSGSRVKLEYLGSADVSQRIGLVFGADFTDEAASSADGFGGQFAANSQIYGGFGQVAIRPVDPLTLTVGVRQDEHSAFGGFTTYRATAAFNVTDTVKLRASYGTGFRAPSNFELFSQDDFGFGPIGNPDLGPEESTSFDIGVDAGFLDDRLTLSASYFRLEIDDLIQFVNRYEQVPGTTTREGVEAEARFAIADWAEIGAAYTYSEAEDEAGARIIRVPRHNASVLASVRPLEGLRLVASATLVSDTVDFGAVRLDDYVLVNANASYAFGETFEVYLRGENLLDEQYQTVLGYGTAGIAGYVGVRARF